MNFSDEHPSLLELTESSGTQLVPLRGAARRSRASARMMAPAGGNPDSEAARKQLVEDAEKQRQQFLERREASRAKQMQESAEMRKRLNAEAEKQRQQFDARQGSGAGAGEKAKE